MNIVMLEPLGVKEEVLSRLAEPLKRMGHSLTAYSDRLEDPAAIVDRAREAEVAVIGNLPMPGSVIRALPKLRFLSVGFTGVDHVDVAACRQQGIAVSNAAGYATTAVAEHALALMLALLRHVPACDRVTRSGGTKAGLIGGELRGRTVGVIGTGAIGIQTTRLLHAFGCTVCGWNRSQNAAFCEAGGRYVELDELLAQSDIVSLHVPLTEDTRGLIGRTEIARMKKGALLINTARGPVVDSAALAQALADGQIGGAGVDVFEIEPPLPVEHPLFAAPNVIVAPHVAFATTEAFVRRAEIVFENIRAWLASAPINVIC